MDQNAFHRDIASSFDDTRLHLIILPTEKCNFHCTYCYEDFLVGRMPAALIGGVKNLLSHRAPGLRRLDVEWFGGEPLIAPDVIEEIASHARDLAHAHPGLIYQGSMTTNGYLLDLETAQTLLDVGVNSYQISLDGPREHHDRTRLRINGAGSYDRIHENLLALRRSSLPVQITLRVHLHPQNLPVMDDFILHLRDTYLVDPRFSLLLKPIERLGGPNDETMATLTHEEEGAALKRLTGLLNRETEGATRAPGSVCYAARLNSFIIRANGDIAKCTVAFEDPRNRVGRLTPDGHLELDDGRLRPWFRALWTMDPEVLGCPLAVVQATPLPSTVAGKRGLPLLGRT